jgi:cell division protease FtsH
MVTQYGMSEVIGPRQVGSGDNEGVAGRDSAGSRDYSDHVAAAVDGEVRRLVDEARQRARAILVEHRAVLDHLAAALVQHETLSDTELSPIFSPLGTVR